MSNVLINEENLTNIANELRKKTAFQKEKTGTNKIICENYTDETYKPREMATAINSIPEKPVLEMTNYNIKGNTVQEGTPIPSTPAEIEAVGNLVTEGEHIGKYAIPIKNSGKNLLNISVGEITVNGITLISDGKTITLNGTCTGNYPAIKITNGLRTALSIESLVSSYSSEEIEQLKNIENYTCKVTQVSGSSTAGQLFAYNSSTRELWTPLSGTNPITVASNNTSFVGIYLGGAGTTFTNYKVKIQIEKGTTATSYEPYVEPIITNIYLNKPLYKIGDVVDEIDFINKKRKNYIRVLELAIIDMDNGDGEIYPGWKNQTQLKLDYPNINTTMKYAGINYYSNINKQVEIASENDYIALNTMGAGVLLLMKNKFNLSQTQWKTLYPNLIFKIAYALNNYYEETIDIPEIPMHNGTNIIEILTEVAPTETTLNYVKKNEE